MRDRRKLFQQARSFVVYYGAAQTSKVAQYDVAIVEPGAYTSSEILEIKEANTLVLGYVTIMELGSFHKMFHFLEENDFIQINGKRLYKEEYDTYVLNLSSNRWQGLLHHHIGRLLLNGGYDGIFMDTIGDVEAPHFTPMESNAQIDHAVGMIKSFRDLYPNHVIVQNNGLEQLCLKTAPYLDGICWENPLFSQKGSEDWSQSVLRRLVKLKEEYGTRSLFLHEENEIKWSPSAGIMAQTLADKYEFLYYNAPAQYLSIP